MATAKRKAGAKSKPQAKRSAAAVAATSVVAAMSATASPLPIDRDGPSYVSIVGSVLTELQGTKEGVSPRHVLEPYQSRFFADDSRIRVWLKSRRIGGTEAVAFEVAITRLTGEVTRDFWFSSADESAAREFMQALRRWCEFWRMTVEIAVDTEVDDGVEYNVFRIEFPERNGRRPKAVAMTSNPKGFRSKGGDVALDEFAFHADAEAMWKAAYPVTTRGGRIIVISSHNGDRTKFAELVQMGLRQADPDRYGEPKAGDFPVSLHVTDIYLAVAEGLAERVNLIELTTFSRDEYLQTLRSGCDSATWEEEYECKPSSEQLSYFPYQLLRPLVRLDDVRSRTSWGEFLADVERAAAASEAGTEFFAGADIARTQDLFSVVVRQRVAGVLRTCGVLRARDLRFGEMFSVLSALMRFEGRDGFIVRRLVTDASGLGMQLGEQLKERFGHRVEPVTFTTVMKESLATLVRRNVEEKTITLPDDPYLLSSYNRVRKLVTDAGNIRFDGERTKDGHCDEFWADALSQHGADRAQRARGRVAEIEGSWV